MKRRISMLAVLLLAGLTLCACAKRQAGDEVYRKVLNYFEQAGFACELADVPQDADVPIYNAGVWRRLVLDGRETVLCYFDESNRADYLSEGIDRERYGLVTRYGLRFILTYDGADERVIGALNDIPQY